MVHFTYTILMLKNVEKINILTFYEYSFVTCHKSCNSIGVIFYQMMPVLS